MHAHTHSYWKNDFNTHGTLSWCDIKSNDMWHLEKVTSPIRIHYPASAREAMGLPPPLRTPCPSPAAVGEQDEGTRQGSCRARALLARAHVPACGKAQDVQTNSSGQFWVHKARVGFLLPPPALSLFPFEQEPALAVPSLRTVAEGKRSPSLFHLFNFQPGGFGKCPSGSVCSPPARQNREEKAEETRTARLLPQDPLCPSTPTSPRCFQLPAACRCPVAPSGEMSHGEGRGTGTEDFSPLPQVTWGHPVSSRG